MKTRLGGASRALVVAMAAASCSGGSTGPSSGNLNVQLSSPTGAEGAVLFTVTGGPVETVQAVSGVAYTAAIDPNTTRVVVTTSLSSGTIARIRIADLSQAPLYEATVNQIAVRPTYAVQNPEQFALSLAP